MIPRMAKAVDMGRIIALPPRIRQDSRASGQAASICAVFRRESGNRPAHGALSEYSGVSGKDLI
jgi:hypothetical protein